MIQPIDQLLNGFPGSFVYGGRRSRDFIDGWRLESNGSRRTLTDPNSGLCVHVDCTLFPSGNAVHLQTSFQHTGTKASATLRTIRALDVSIPNGQTHPRVTSMRGSTASLTDFIPVTSELRPGEISRYEPTGGRSSDGQAPFFAVDAESTQVAIALGWTGQWVFEVEHEGRNVRILAGLRDADLYLQPGETITAPSVLMTATTQGLDDAIRRARTVIREHIDVHARDSRAMTPISHSMMHAFHMTGDTDEDLENAALERAAAIGLEGYWVDACWYGRTTDWWNECGNWTPKLKSFPNGLAPLAEAAHRRNMSFTLWFEPERAQPGTDLVRSHPEYVIPTRDMNGDECFLLNLGLEDARSHICDLLSELIDEYNLDIYRQDFNIQPLDAWRATDDPERRGMTEIRHIEGLYALWDELRQRFPALVIDNCASGGRRIDLETIRRSIAQIRSDWADYFQSAPGRDLGNQIQISGLSRWLWQHGGEFTSFEPYSVRSAIATGALFYHELPTTPARIKRASKAIAEMKRLRPFFVGDYYELTALTPSETDWWAYQIHDERTDSGFALFFRRRKVPALSRSFDLQAIAQGGIYEVTRSFDYSDAESGRYIGSALAHIDVEIDEAPGSMLLEYRRVAR